MSTTYLEVPDLRWETCSDVSEEGTDDLETNPSSSTLANIKNIASAETEFLKYDLPQTILTLPGRFKKQAEMANGDEVIMAGQIKSGCICHRNKHNVKKHIHNGLTNRTLEAQNDVKYNLPHWVTHKTIDGTESNNIDGTNHQKCSSLEIRMLNHAQPFVQVDRDSHVNNNNSQVNEMCMKLQTICNKNNDAELCDNGSATVLPAGDEETNCICECIEVTKSTNDGPTLAEDITIALQWIKQQVLLLKQQDKALVRQFLDLRSTIHQLRGQPNTRLHKPSKSAEYKLKGSPLSRSSASLNDDSIYWGTHTLGSLSPTALPQPELFQPFLEFRNRASSMVSVAMRSPVEENKGFFTDENVNGQLNLVDEMTHL